jgi:malonyl-CoA decarboxylase
VEPADPVARFHLGNGARLERINWLGNTDARGLQESYGVMANYLYDPATIVGNHEAFARDGTVVRSADVDALMKVNDLDTPHGYRQREPSSIPGHVTTIHS